MSQGGGTCRLEMAIHIKKMLQLGSGFGWRGETPATHILCNPHARERTSDHAVLVALSPSPHENLLMISRVRQCHTVKPRTILDKQSNLHSLSLTAQIRADTSRCFTEQERFAALTRCVRHTCISPLPTHRVGRESSSLRLGTRKGKRTHHYENR
jgi:hypothetical protein